MTYVFVFLGEFGVELLNWQGVVRKLRPTLAEGDRVVCCSRASLHPLYESCDVYLDIADVPRFRQSRAMAYFALPDPASSWDSLAARRFDKALKTDLRRYILEALAQRPDFVGDDDIRFVFSSDKTIINGLTFGRSRHGPVGVILATLVEQLRKTFPASIDHLEHVKRHFYTLFRSWDRNREANIYDLLDLDNNCFVRIEPDFAFLPAVRSRVGFDLSEPFVLCQTRQRDIGQRSPDRLPWPAIWQLLETLAGEIKVVLLDFDTGRWLDSYSAFAPLSAARSCFHLYPCRSFPEQAILVHFARHCLFFTEGDFGSHIYVPPLLGRDVTALAPASVYALGTTPITFWNEHVFRFGGQIIARRAEDVFASAETVNAFTAELRARCWG